MANRTVTIKYKADTTDLQEVDKQLDAQSQRIIGGNIDQENLDSLVAKVRDVTKAVDEKTEAFKREAETVKGSVSAEINSLGQLKDTIDKISSSIPKLYSKTGGKSGSPFTDLVSGLKKLSGISPDVLDKAETVSSALGVLKNIEFTKVKGNSIGEGLKSISAGIDYEQLNKINDINFSGLLPLNQIRVNANAFQNLANGLSALSGANVDLGLIDKLSGIDFSGLNGLNGIKQATDSSIALSKNFINSQQSRIDAAITRARNAGVDESELAELKNASTVLRQTFNAANVGNLDINTAMQQEVASIDAAVNKMDLLIDRKQQEAAAQTSINADLNQYNTMLHERDKLVDKMKTRNGWDNQDVTRMQQLFQSMQDMQTKYRGDSSFSNLFALGDAQEKDIKAVYSSVLDEMAVKIQTIKTKFNDSGVQEGSTYKQMADDMQHVLDLKSRFETSDLFNASEAKESFTYMQRITNQAKDLSSALANEQKISKYLKSVSKYDGKSANDFTSPEDYNKIVDKLKQIQTISKNGVFSDADVDKVKTLANEIDEIGNSLVEVKNKSGTIIGNITEKTNTKEAINQLKSMLTAQVESEGNKIEFGNVKGDYDALEYNVITKSGDLQKYTASIDSATGAVRSLMRSESEYVSQGQKFINSITGKFAELTRYMSVMDVVQKGLQFVKSGLSSVIEINTAMTELKKVTDETNQTYDTFQQTAGNVAKTLGSSTTDVISATGDYARLGHTLKESTELAKSSVVLKNVSEYENIDDSTKALTAMTQAYRNMDSMDITDKLNNIGNNYSISTEELATGLQKASSVLSLMGNSFDESAALITAGNATLQDVNSVAAGLRTISLRIVGTEEAKKELEDIGEDVSDYVVQTSAKQRQAILDYTAVASNGGKGFDILDANGNYKNTYEILKGIADIYAEIQAEDKKFGTNRASALVELLAGKNRSAIASSILSNPEMLANVKESSANSAGSAMEEESKYLESIQGHIDILRSSFQNLWADTINPAVPNFFLTLGTNILDVVDKVGLLKTGILAITAIGSFKGAGRANLYSCPSKLKMPADILFTA